jgi:ParB-like chromosome segregation protein Spo0J
MSTIDDLHTVLPIRRSELSHLNVTLGAPQLVEIRSLSFGESPRSQGENVEHTATLMQCRGPLPPILVHRPSMQIIDGFHRVRAAQAKGENMIEAMLLDGSTESAFVTAVAVNLGNGLPLSMEDRRRAAARIVAFHPHWSDRAIARLVGLSAKTIKLIRCTSDQVPNLDSRTGRDGRVRPVDATAGRLAAAEYLAAHPQSSLRTVARHAGISPNTVRDVRNRMLRGDDPTKCSRRTAAASVPSPARRAVASSAASPPPAPPRIAETSCTEVRPLVASLSRDPAIRMTETGRELLRWLHLHMVEDVDVAALLAAVPGHRQSHLAEIAARCAVNWSVIANKMSPPSSSARKQRVTSSGRTPHAG